MSAKGQELYFENQDLYKILQNSKSKQTRGIIYSWSPHMVFSFEGIQELKEEAKKYNIEVTVVLDQFADSETVKKTVKENNIDAQDCKRINSQVLNDLGITIHYPTYLFYENGEILTPRYPGYEEPYKLQKLFITKFKKLK